MQRMQRRPAERGRERVRRTVRAWQATKTRVIITGGGSVNRITLRRLLAVSRTLPPPLELKC